MGIEYTVIVPIYKVEKYIRKCIDSILAQSFKNFELVLVDDGSPDNCPDICDEYAEKDERIKVVHKKNGGLVSARNAGIAVARGDYICYVDGDDWIREDLLENIYKRAIKDYYPDMIIFGIVKKFLDKDEEILNDMPEGLYGKEVLIKYIYPYMMYDSRKIFCKGLIFPAACNKTYKTKLLKEHYCKEERIRMGEDNAFVYECAWFSNDIYICNEIMYYYNQLNPGAMNHTYDPNRFINNKYLYNYMDNMLSGQNKILDNQLNAFKAYWLIMAIFHEIKSNNSILQAASHVKEQMKQHEPLKYIQFAGLPISAKVFLLFLKLRMYIFVLSFIKIIQKYRK
ncbi:glycosyltransferase family 2 protein [uncultured Phocaeicola sp.]|uniref:glycosyltransferase family 2 protein n=1 Tax=uncultured Phocaeicola sp. TaxID=990718 RepID=UPI002623DC59|nr:glycosyltransferase family 2 protein [uncultured Phocaeicola sp.]